MKQSDPSGKLKDKGIFEVIAHTFNGGNELAPEGGLSAVYSGIGPEVGRGILSSALTLMVKEKIFKFTKATMYAAVGRAAEAGGSCVLAGALRSRPRRVPGTAPVAVGAGPGALGELAH